MQNTANLKLKKPDYTDLADIKDFNDNMDIIDTQLAETTTILTASGTANAITLNVTLQDKKKYSFKAIANSTGTVTINGKPFKKLDGTTISNVKANKVYDFYYDATANSVFNLAKADGNATVADVLAGKTFSNGDDIGLVGTIQNRSFAVNQGYTPAKSTKSDYNGDLCIEPYTGYYEEGVNEGGFGSILAYDSNFIPANILSGKSIFGVVGTATPVSVTPSDTTLLSKSFTYTDLSDRTKNTTYTKFAEAKINLTGTVRVVFDLKNDSHTSSIGYGRIYINGVPKGTERIATGNTYIVFSEDLIVNSGDLIELYCHTNDSNWNVYCDYFKINGNVNIDIGTINGR